MSAASSLTNTPTKPVRVVRGGVGGGHSGFVSAASSLTNSPARPTRLNVLGKCSLGRAASAEGDEDHDEGVWGWGELKDGELKDGVVRVWTRSRLVTR